MKLFMLFLVRMVSNRQEFKILLFQFSWLNAFGFLSRFECVLCWFSFIHLNPIILHFDQINPPLKSIGIFWMLPRTYLNVRSSAEELCNFTFFVKVFCWMSTILYATSMSRHYFRVYANISPAFTAFVLLFNYSTIKSTRYCFERRKYFQFYWNHFIKD